MIAKFFFPFALCLLALTLGCARRPPAPIIHVLPLGDSITQGGRSDREEWTYRYPLFYKLIAAGYDVDFVGSMNAGVQSDAQWPSKDGVAFDLDHEGHYGWKTVFVRDRLQEWSTKWAAVPDIALIHLGTNDQKAKDFNAAIIQPLKDIISLLRKKNPHMVILIGHLNSNSAAAVTIRRLVEAMAKKLNTTQSPIATVNHFENWVESPNKPGSDTFDGLHPNPQGQVKMADRWFIAMQPFLPAKADN